jgi:outer membrane protein OmpA-like peptidoglycan-associated protein
MILTDMEAYVMKFTFLVLIYSLGNFVAMASMIKKSEEILQFSEEFASTKLAIIPTSKTMEPGQLFKSSRRSSLNTEAYIPTGLLKIVEVRGDLAFAVVVENGTGLSKTLFQKFHGPMAGDRITEENPTIAKNIEILPDVEETYLNLFRDPRASPSSFEMTEEGVTRMTERLKPFRSSRVNMVLVEGYTDKTGLREANQAESYQRALAVRTMILKELDLAPEKVVAIGYGDGDQKPIRIAEESRRLNRRIVIRAINLPQDSL